MRHLNQYPQAAILLMLLAACASPCHAAAADILAHVNAIRAKGCAGHPGAERALRHAPELDRAPEALASGRRLAQAMEDAEYVAVQSVMLEADGSDAAIANRLERPGCVNIVK